MVGRPYKALTPATVKSLNKTGRYADGEGLYLQVSKWGSKSWIYRYSCNDRRIEMGLGSVLDVTLSEARELAKDFKRERKDGVNPIISRDNRIRENRLSQVWTFDKCAEAFIAAHSPSWKSRKHAAQWKSTLATYASPVIGSVPIKDINTAMVMRVIEPIWKSKTETASRVRGRLEKVIAWATVNGYREGQNPAMWKNNLDQLLPAPNKLKEERHHPALPYAEIPVFMSQFDKAQSISAFALKFTILTGMRTGEVIGASWDEIDFWKKIWTIPKERMKGENPREHRVPLSTAALDLLNSLPKTNGWIFPSPYKGNHISNTAMLTYLKKQLNRPDLTVHGFRSTFRDWCAEVTNYPREVAEAALAHANKDKTEAAYQRGDLLEKRRSLMQDWSDYVFHDDGTLALRRALSR